MQLADKVLKNDDRNWVIMKAVASRETKQYFLAFSTLPE